jgi:ATP-dependent exoDNAse (exonuclease V) beta subunit
MSLTLDPEQREAATSLDQHTVCLAPAGSGKTAVLAARVVAALLGVDHEGRRTGIDRVAALTFTREAGALLRRRIHGVLSDALTEQMIPTPGGQRALGRGELDHLRLCRHRLEEADIGTIDAFCASRLRRYGAAIGFPVERTIASEVEIAQAAERAWLCFRRTPGDWEALAAWLGPWSFADALPEILDRTLALPAGVLVPHDADPAATILALRRPALERVADLVDLLRRLLVPPGVRAVLADIPPRPAPTAPAAEVAAWLRQVDRLSTRSVRQPHVQAAIRDIQHLIDAPNAWPDRRGTLTERARRGSLAALIAWDGTPPADLAPLVAACDGYRSLVAGELERMGRVTFAQVEHALRQLITRGEAGLQQLDHLVVDEAQDCNALQLGLVDACATTGVRVLLVGDDRQSIYGFRHAAPDLLLAMAARSQSDPAWRTVRLQRNYRTHPALVAAMTAVFGASARAEAFRMGEVVAGRTGDATALRLHRFRITLPEGVSRTSTQAAAIQAEVVADDLAADLRAGADPTGIAVLFRTRTRMHLYARACDRAGVPYDTDYRGGFLDAQEVADVLAILRLALCDRDREALAIAAAGPWGPDTLADRRQGVAALAPGGDPAVLLQGALGDAVTRTRARLRSDGVGGALRGLIYDPACGAWAGSLPGATRRLANLEILLGVVDALAAQGRARPGDILADLHERRRLAVDLAEASGAALGARGVRLLSYHAAKGLEWDTVILPETERPFDLRDLSSGVLTHATHAHLRVAMRPDRGFALGHSLLQDQVANRCLAEEARLLYVACTRARERLVAYACARTGDETDGASGAVQVLSTAAGDWIDRT